MAVPTLFLPEVDPARVLTGILRIVTANVQGARGAAIADRNGLPVASASPQPMDLRVASAMAALAAQTFKQMLSGLGYQRFQSAVIDGEDVKLLVVMIRDWGSLMVVMDPSADLRWATVEAQWAAEEAAAVLRL